MGQSATAAPAEQRSTPWLAMRVGVIVLAAIETLGAIVGFPDAFIERQHTSARIALAQWLANARLVLAPVIAGLALILAIIALAILCLSDWITELPTLPVHGLDLSATYGGLLNVVHFLIVPTAAAAAIALALRNQRLGLATLLVALPTLLSWLGALAFAINLFMYGSDRGLATA
jgi:hypothetical protein